MRLIDCQNLSFSYEGKIILENLNFQINKGDYLCILGENGSGKTTLMKGLLNLKSPSSGKIVMENDMKKTKIGYLPQQTQAQKDFPASVSEVVLSGCINSLKGRFFFGKKEKEKANENMEKLGVYHLKNRCYRELSGGQQQRVLLARTLCATETMICLDEPATGLDPLVTKDLYKVIDDINKKLGITVVMISHDVESAVKRATHILHLNQGQVFFGKTEDYIKSKVGKTFLGGACDV